MFENDIELKRLASEDFSSYKGILSLGSSEDILTPSDIAGYRVDSNEDYNNLLSSYEEEGSGIFGLRRIVDGEIVGILAARHRNDEASIGVFVGKPYRNFQYATTSIEEALSALDAEKVKSVSFEVPSKDKRAVFLAEHFTETKAVQNDDLVVYKVDLAKHKEEYIPRMVGLEIEGELCDVISALADLEKSPERDEQIRDKIAAFCADHPDVNGKAIVAKISSVLSGRRDDIGKQIAEEDIEK